MAGEKAIAEEKIPAGTPSGAQSVLTDSASSRGPMGFVLVVGECGKKRPTVKPQDAEQEGRKTRKLLKVVERINQKK